MERTYFFDFAKLHAQGRRGALLTRLMMAVNDLVLANVAMRPYVIDPSKTGAQARYFVRLQCGHIAEALRLITQVSKDDRLTRLVGECSASARKAFEQLRSHADGADRQKFQECVRDIRNKVGFHYDEAMVQEALARRAGRPALSRTKVTVATDILNLRFHAADDIEASIVTRLLWRIPEGIKDDALSVQADERLQYVSEICKMFVRFNCVFLPRALRDLGVLSS